VLPAYRARDQATVASSDPNRRPCNRVQPDCRRSGQTVGIIKGRRVRNGQGLNAFSHSGIPGRDPYSSEHLVAPPDKFPAAAASIPPGKSGTTPSRQLLSTRNSVPFFIRLDSRLHPLSRADGGLTRRKHKNRRKIPAVHFPSTSIAIRPRIRRRSESTTRIARWPHREARSVSGSLP
jgi:hypothetical protein